jgi:hypothetical protein
MNRLVVDTEEIRIEALADMEEDEAKMLLGKTISKVDAREFGLAFTFTDGTRLEVSGHTYTDGSLDVVINRGKRNGDDQSS